jgi:hypothetical protein
MLELILTTPQRMKLSIPVIIFSIIAFSCQDESLVKPDSVYKKQITNYLTSLKANVKAEQWTKLESFERRLNFKEVRIYDLKTTEQALIVDIDDFPELKADKVKALLYLNENEVVRGFLISIENTRQDVDYNELILSVIDKRSIPKYTVKSPFTIPSNA